MKLVIGVPTTGLVAMGFSYSLCGLTSYIAARGIATLPDESVEISINVAESSVIHSNRERIIMEALDKDATHVLFLDHDMVFEPQIIDVLAGRRQEVVCTNYVLKQEDTDFVAVDLQGRRVPTTDQSTGLLPIHYSGFGVSLFDLAAFKRTPQPWFLPKWVPEMKTYTTEDVPCYEKLREYGATVYLDQDASKLINGHIGLRAYSYKHWSPKPKSEASKPVLSAVEAKRA
jgi:hypothetical protein